ncbi:MAG: hypothetical protein J7M25_16065 [Deltaproteobacteria bacterium]|nr:hypothetical protein [Deltaproteobacteria bacterium]
MAELAQATGIRNTKTLVRHLVSVMSLMASGGEHISDIEVLRADGGLGRVMVEQRHTVEGVSVPKMEPYAANLAEYDDLLEAAEEVLS